MSAPTTCGQELDVQREILVLVPQYINALNMSSGETVVVRSQTPKSTNLIYIVIRRGLYALYH